MKIIDIDCLRIQTVVTLKDTDKKEIDSETYDHDTYSLNEIADIVYRVIKNMAIDEAHTDTTSYGMVYYDLLSNTDVKDIIVPFKFKRMLPKYIPSV